MSRIYIISHAKNENVIRFVRAKTLNGAIRALAKDLFTAKAATTDEIFEASKSGSFDVLDAIEEDPADPGPAPTGE